MKIIDLVRGINNPPNPKPKVNPIGNYVPGQQCLYNISEPKTK